MKAKAKIKIRTKTRTKTKAPKAPRPSLPRASDEMKQWSAMLGHELHSWPHIKTNPMFGMLAFHRKATIFAALPITRVIGAANSVIFKIKIMPPDLLRRKDQDSRVCTGKTIRAKGWHAFEINSEEDLRDALWWLSQAYELAK
jgi:hypothetical protein